MSLYTTAQGESNFFFATNLDSSSTEKAVRSGISVSSSQFGTVTQNSNSLTGNASYTFGSTGRVLHQWGGGGGISNFIHEVVFKRDSNPAADVTLFRSLDEIQIVLTADGYIKAYVDPASVSASSITTTTDFCDGKFHHVVVSYMDGSTGFRLYVDGTLIQAKTTGGNLGYSGLVNLGSYASSSGTGPSAYSEATIDFYAFYRDVQLTNAQVDTFVANHMATFANRTVTGTVSTASALAVQPAISTSSVLSVDPATASALAANTQVSNFNTPVMLDGYMSGLSLEQWYKFDEVKKIHNYGTGGDAETSWAFYNETTTIPQAGIQGSGALKLKGNKGAPNNVVQLAFGVDEPYSPEITDNEFSVGFWFKADSGFGAKDTAFITYQELFSDNSYQIRATSEGYIRFVMNHNGSTYIASTVSIDNTNWCDGNWHFVHARRSVSGNAIKLTIDNGTEISTTTPGNGSPAVGTAVFGLTGTTGANNKYAYVSHMFVTGYNTIGSTERAAIITAASIPVQAAAGIVQPRVRFESAFNDATNSYSPSLEYRLDDLTGAPTNFGSIRAFSAGINGEAVTFGNASLNNKAYRFTNADTYLQGDWDGVDGLYSADNRQTVSVVFKANGYTSFEQILASAGMYGFIGAGITIAMSGSTGHLTARVNQGFGGTDTDSLTTTINVGDNKWHHAVGVKDGSSFKLYLDGKEVATMSTAAVNLTDFGAWGVSAEGKYNFGQGSASKDTYIDEFALIPGALGADDVFDLYQSIQNKSEWTASAAAVQPTIQTGFGPMIYPDLFTASALSPRFIAPSIYAATANSLFQMPNFEAIDNTTNLADPMIASAQAENPGWDIGENNQVLHMDASAAMGDARAFIPGFWNANPMIANPATAVMPGFTSTKGALIKPQSLNANAFFVLPPAYYLITDDLWYQKLLDVDYQSSSTPGKITFFNTNTSIYLGGSYDGWTAYASRSPFVTPYGYNLYDSPLPVATAGGIDLVNRKTLRLRNIALAKNDAETYSGGWTMETLIKTTKANQFIAGGRFLGDTSNSLSRNKRTGITLNNGRVSFTSVRDFVDPAFNNTSDIAFSGFKNIADGEWHHLIIQYRNSGVDQNSPRMQVWIDGQLDIQRFGYSSYVPNQIGFNSNDVNVSSDFELSAISINKESYVLEKETLINYLAAIGVVPIEAPVATASAVAGDSKASGNRARALMLYFWPTAVEQGSKQYEGFTSTESANQLTTMDYFTAPPQEYEGWDVFPVDITGKWVSELVKTEAYGAENISLTTISGNVTPWGKPDTKTVLVNKKGSFRDPVTDAARYIDLINDIDLSQFDMIMFKNYPNDPQEKDAFTGSEIVDAYFNLRESKLFEDFVKSLRAAVDTGLSLMVSNAQLALDLKIVDRVETVPDMDDSGIVYEEGDDPYAPTQMFDTGAAELPTPPQYRAPLGWKDTWKNNRTRIVNTYPGITDYPALVKTQTAFWESTDEFRWGGADRVFHRYEHKDALVVGDEFVISTTGAKADKNRTYLATPFANVKAGKIITAFANTIRRGLDLIDNPYRNYAQSIVVSPGDVLDGKQVGGKIYVNFTEEINKVEESASVELISDYWVNYAYQNGAITIEERDELLAAPYNQNQTPYWSLNGMHLLQQASQEFELDSNLSKPGVQKQAVKTRKVNKNGGVSFQSVPTGSVFFSSTYSWQYPLASFEMPSMPTRGFRWLSNREVLEGTIIRPTAVTASAEMQNALGVPDKVNNFRAQSMVATALIEETSFSSGARIIPVLPATADATIVKPGSTIAVAPMTSVASMFANSRAKVASEDQVVLYLMHTDPILYIREDVIK